MNVTMNIRAKKRLQMIKQQLSPKPSINRHTAQTENNTNMVQNSHPTHYDFGQITYTQSTVNSADVYSDNNHNDWLQAVSAEIYPTPSFGEEYELHNLDNNDNDISITKKKEKITKKFDSVPDRYFCLLCKKQGKHWIMNCPLNV